MPSSDEIVEEEVRHIWRQLLLQSVVLNYRVFYYKIEMLAEKIWCMNESDRNNFIANPDPLLAFAEIKLDRTQKDAFVTLVKNFYKGKMSRVIAKKEKIVVVEEEEPIPLRLSLQKLERSMQALGLLLLTPEGVKQLYSVVGGYII